MKLLSHVKSILKNMGCVGSVLGLLICQNPVFAATEAEGVALFNQGNFAAALPVFQTLAEQESVMAEYYLGMMHYFGYGMHPDSKGAKDWFSKAAMQGHPASQTYLGELLMVERQYLSAYMWLELAIQQGNTTSRKYLNKLTSLMTSKEIEHARQMALQCKASHYEDCEE